MEFLSNLIAILAFFIIKQRLFLKQKPLRQQIRPLLNVHYYSNPPGLSENRQKLYENFENLIFFGIFVSFGPNLRRFSKTKGIYVFEEASWTTNFFLVEAFQLSKIASVSTI